MRDVVANVVRRFLVRATGFPVADDGPPAPLQQRTKLLLADLRATVAKQLRGSSGSLHQALVALDRALKKYDPKAAPSADFEREFQFMLLLATKEMDAEVPSAGDLLDIAKRVDRHLGST